MPDDNMQDQWMAIIARALAFLCIQSSSIKDAGLAGQAKFLKGLGLPNKDVAAILSTSEGSVRGLLSYSSKTKRKEEKSARIQKEG